MKKFAFITITALLFTACNTAPKPDEKAEHEKDSLQAIIQEQESVLKNYLSSFSEIEHDLDSINIRQKNIYLKTEKTSDLKTPMVVDEINHDISAINALIEKNKNSIAKLNAELKSSNGKNKQLEEAIKTLNKQISQKEEELSDLNSKLTGLHVEIFQLQATIGFLNLQNSIKDATIAEEKTELHKAFYIIGTSKGLEKDNIIDKKGGLLGIGKTTELNDNFDASKFTEIDYTQKLIIPLGNKKVDIITSHSNNSYRFEKKDGLITELIITNPEEFWKASKYLVIVVNS